MHCRCDLLSKLRRSGGHLPVIVIDFTRIVHRELPLRVDPASLFPFHSSQALVSFGRLPISVAIIKDDEQ
jgi:hypothetical protein